MNRVSAQLEHHTVVPYLFFDTPSKHALSTGATADPSPVLEASRQGESTCAICTWLITATVHCNAPKGILLCICSIRNHASNWLLQKLANPAPSKPRKGPNDMAYEDGPAVVQIVSIANSKKGTIVSVAVMADHRGENFVKPITYLVRSDARCQADAAGALQFPKMEFSRVRCTRWMCMGTFFCTFRCREPGRCSQSTAMPEIGLLTNSLCPRDVHGHLFWYVSMPVARRTQ